MKYLLTFIAGLIVGFIVALYYDILSKPSLPTEPTDCQKEFERLGFKFMPSSSRGHCFALSVEDTQPVRVLDLDAEVGAWELDEWTRLVSE
jgi:hypothetical protein